MQAKARKEGISVAQWIRKHINGNGRMRSDDLLEKIETMIEKMAKGIYRNDSTDTALRHYGVDSKPIENLQAEMPKTHIDTSRLTRKERKRIERAERLKVKDQSKSTA